MAFLAACQGRMKILLGIALLALFASNAEADWRFQRYSDGSTYAHSDATRAAGISWSMSLGCDEGKTLLRLAWKGRNSSIGRDHIRSLRPLTISIDGRRVDVQYRATDSLPLFALDPSPSFIDALRSGQEISFTFGETGERADFALAGAASAIGQAACPGSRYAGNSGGGTGGAGQESRGVFFARAYGYSGAANQHCNDSRIGAAIAAAQLRHVFSDSRICSRPKWDRRRKEYVCENTGAKWPRPLTPAETAPFMPLKLEASSTLAEIVRREGCGSSRYEAIIQGIVKDIERGR